MTWPAKKRRWVPSWSLPSCSLAGHGAVVDETSCVGVKRPFPGGFGGFGVGGYGGWGYGGYAVAWPRRAGANHTSAL
jgi:hypothetical protein